MFFKKNTACTSLPMAKAQTELQNDKSIHLIDVRSYEEYCAGHIPGSVSLPLDKFTQITGLVPDKDARIFVYCLSGARSQSACMQFARLGYTQVYNIGGVTQWRGKLERSVGA